MSNSTTTTTETTSTPSSRRKNQQQLEGQQQEQQHGSPQARPREQQSREEIPEETLTQDARLYEYTSNANPSLPEIPVLTHPPSLHASGPTRVIPFDLSQQLGVPYPATSPNLLASFLRMRAGESLSSRALATSQVFYVIRGAGSTASEFGTVTWSEGDVITLPATHHSCEHHANSDATMYWVSDEPLLRYLGVAPMQRRFRMTVYRREDLRARVEELRHEEGAEHRNRLGALLGNRLTEDDSRSMTHSLWSLLNVLPARSAQRPHRHNSVALDLAVEAPPQGQAYTLMGPELGPDGWVKDPVRVDWSTGGIFVTPPGWWHSHHNDSDTDAWVFPVQDAGLHIHQRTLNIEFAKDSMADQE